MNVGTTFSFCPLSWQPGLYRSPHVCYTGVNSRLSGGEFIGDQRGGVPMLKQGPLSGKTLGDKYLLGELLGKGGFGAVYQAENRLLRRQQAVKVLLEEHF